MDAKARFKIGLAFLVAGIIMPFGAVFIAKTDWPLSVKGLVGGFLVVGGPEIMTILAVAVMGRENYDVIIKKIFSWFKKLKPSGTVSKLRYTIGLILFLVPIIPSYIMAYIPNWLPDVSPERFYINITSDVIFISSFFVLGGDFWDKIRALFIKDAKAVFPEKIDNNLNAKV
jgi:hypothetical protein